MRVHYANPEMQQICCQEVPHEYVHLQAVLDVLLAYIQVADTLESLSTFLQQPLDQQGLRLTLPISGHWVLTVSIQPRDRQHPNVITLLLESVLERTRPGRR